MKATYLNFYWKARFIRDLSRRLPLCFTKTNNIISLRLVTRSQKFPQKPSQVIPFLSSSPCLLVSSSNPALLTYHSSLLTSIFSLTVLSYTCNFSQVPFCSPLLRLSGIKWVKQFTTNSLLVPEGSNSTKTLGIQLAILVWLTLTLQTLIIISTSVLNSCFQPAKFPASINNNKCIFNYHSACRATLVQDSVLV